MEETTSAEAGPGGTAANQHTPTRRPANETRAAACCWGRPGRGRRACGPGFEILPERSMSGTTAAAPAAARRSAAAPATPGASLARARSAPGKGPQPQPGLPARGPRGPEIPGGPTSHPQVGGGGCGLPKRRRFPRWVRCCAA